MVTGIVKYDYNNNFWIFNDASCAFPVNHDFWNILTFLYLILLWRTIQCFIFDPSTNVNPCEQELSRHITSKAYKTTVSHNKWPAWNHLSVCWESQDIIADVIYFSHAPGGLKTQTPWSNIVGFTCGYLIKAQPWPDADSNQIFESIIDLNGRDYSWT